MTDRNDPLPKSQVEISQNTIQPYLPQGKGPVPTNKNRENQRTRANDEVKDFTVGLKDVDQAIIYYFNNVIRPSVIQNGIRQNVPVIYGSPERWASAQKDGFYRDKNGKIQVPLIMFKRDSVEKNRTLGNKMDANNPLHFGIFEKRYSSKNVYDRFSALSNREPVKEYFGVIMPDYVNIVYSCTIFTEYTEQMNSIVESINFASDSYWGDPERFKFRASIDTYTTAVEMVQGQDRNVKTTFQIKLAGYIIPDTINTNIGNSNKFFSKASVTFQVETAGTKEILNARANTPEKSAPVRFYDRTTGGNTIIVNTSETSGMTQEQIDYLQLNNTAIASNVIGTGTAIFTNKTIVDPPSGFTTGQEAFNLYINSTYIPTSQRTVSQNGANIQVVFNTNAIGYLLSDTDEIVIVGKLN
jgi:hypothetical protein